MFQGGFTLREVESSLVTVVFLCATVDAQTPEPVTQSLPEELTLDRALEILSERHPLLGSERQREAAAAGELEQAQKLPNPAFSLDTESFGEVQGDSAPQELFLSVHQPVLLGGKRGKRTELAAPLLRAARSDVRAFERELSYRLKVVYAVLVRAQSNLEGRAASRGRGPRRSESSGRHTRRRSRGQGVRCG